MKSYFYPCDIYKLLKNHNSHVFKEYFEGRRNAFVNAFVNQTITLYGMISFNIEVNAKCQLKQRKNCFLSYSFIFLMFVKTESCLVL